MSKGRIKIGQIFLITHAKNLIYNNFSIGSNYLVHADGLHIIHRDECENVLRSCGISFVEEKILFVEGKTETKYLEELCAHENIKLRQLANCTEILQIYKSLLRVKELVTVPKFVFMLDHDTRSDERIQKLRDQDSAFFDEHIIFLPVHEIENFLLEEKTLYEIINNYLVGCPHEPISPDIILQKMHSLADETLYETKKKYLNYELDTAVKGLAKLVRQQDISIQSKEQYSAYVHRLLSTDSLTPYIEAMVTQYDIMSDKYSGENWEKNWKSLCDGKIVFNKLCGFLGGQYKMNVSILKSKVFTAVTQDPDSAFTKLWKHVVEKF